MGIHQGSIRWFGGVLLAAALLGCEGPSPTRNEDESQVLVFPSAHALDRTNTVQRGPNQEWPAGGQNCQAIVPANQAGVLAWAKMNHPAMTP